MRILVTGADGFVGRHVAQELAAHGHGVVAFDRGFTAPPSPSLEAQRIGDLCDAETLAKLVAAISPDACLHLAAIAFVPDGWTNPEQMFSVNVNGTLNVLEALRKHAPKARTLVVSTAQVYGPAPRPHPITEDDSLCPETMYAISKAAADRIALVYQRHHGMPIMVARPQNHIGPGQSPQFAISSFARQLRDIALGRQVPEVRVGNMQSVRDFTDVRDVVRAYRLLLESGAPGQAYNIGSGRRVTIRDVFDELCSIAGAHPRVIEDCQRFRATDASPLLDIARIKRETGWEPKIPLSTTLRDIYSAL